MEKFTSALSIPSLENKGSVCCEYPDKVRIADLLMTPMLTYHTLTEILLNFHKLSFLCLKGESF